MPRRARDLAGAVARRRRPPGSSSADWARWPPQASRTAEPFEVNWTRNSAVLLPPVGPAWDGPLIELIVPPQMVSRRVDARVPLGAGDASARRP